MNLRQAHNNLLHRDWIAQARAVRIEDEIARRDIKLNGRGPERCGAAAAGAQTVTQNRTLIGRSSDPKPQNREVACAAACNATGEP